MKDTSMEILPYKVTPWKHQELAVRNALAGTEYALLFDMGTGKTFTMINILRNLYYRQKRILPTLILCPISVCLNWQREITEYSKIPKEKTLVLLSSSKKRVKDLLLFLKENPDGGIIITNFECLTMHGVFKELMKLTPAVVVVDESQKIKNPKTIRTRKVINLGDFAQYRYILSGSPILNNPMDIFAQYRFLDGGKTFGKNFLYFRNTYFYDKNASMPIQKYFPKWVPKPGLDAEFNKLIFKKGMRVLKADCLSLPPLVKKTILTYMSIAQEKAYKDMLSNFIAYWGEEKVIASIALTKGLRLMQIASGIFPAESGESFIFEGHGKRAALKDILEQISVEHKTIVWACFKENYQDIEKLLDEMKIPFVQIIGGLTDRTRQDAIDKFQNDDSIRVMIANQGAGGIGINLTKASYSVYYSRNFSLEADIQSEARNYRGGSEMHQKITRIDLVTADTIEEDIVRALSSKINMSEAILKIGNMCVNNKKFI